MANSHIPKHLIVLMMENQTFDRIFGYLDGVNGLKGKEQEYYNVYNGVKYYVGPNASSPPQQDPKHSFDATKVCLDYQNGQPTLGGFVENSPVIEGDSSEVMQSYGTVKNAINQHLPALWKLAEEGLVFDNWFSSMPGPTWPNRLFTHCATSGGSVSATDSTPPSSSGDTYWKLPSIQHLLSQHDYSWAVYDYGPHTHYKTTLARAIEDINEDQHPENYKMFTQFFKDVANPDSNLANYIFLGTNDTNSHDINGISGNSMHATECVECGDKVIARVYEALRASSYWEDAALLIVFDEHGGFYDHVVPPSGVPPKKDGKYQYPNSDEYDFTSLGLRVPAVLVSPYVMKGVNSDQYENVSIISTLRDIFRDTNENPLQALTDRDASASSFRAVFQENKRTDYPMTLPRPPKSSSYTCCQATPINAVINWDGKEETCFFDGSACIQFDNKANQAEQGYPKNISTQFEGYHWPSDSNWNLNLDDACRLVNEGEKKYYFFKDGDYLRIDIDSKKVDKGPVAISSGWYGWPASWDSPDAAFGVFVQQENGEEPQNDYVFFFKGEECLLYNNVNNNTEGEPNPCSKVFEQWPEHWNEVDAAVMLGDVVYVFRGLEYIRITVDTNGSDNPKDFTFTVDADYPKTIYQSYNIEGDGNESGNNWPGLSWD